MGPSASKRLNLNGLGENLRTRLLGRSILFSRRVVSTNDWARKLASQGAPEGTVVVAETQTRGRGRLNREWVSPPGGLWLSLILRPKQSLARSSDLTFVAGLAVAQILRELYNLRVETKWPNDVIINGRKICGILGETSIAGKAVEAVVLGIGINANFVAERVFSEPLKAEATSLETELGRKVRLEELLDQLLAKLEVNYLLYARKGFSPILTRWKRYASFLGREVNVTDRNERVTGVACDVDKEGVLILMLRNGEVKRVSAGDVSLWTK